MHEHNGVTCILYLLCKIIYCMLALKVCAVACVVVQ
jgi:hypothetical protein